jgi:hypothetical protein
MKSILDQQPPQRSPCAPTRLRQETQTGGSRRSASAARPTRSAPPSEKALDCASGLLDVVSAPPIAMAAMIEPRACVAKEARDT